MKRTLISLAAALVMAGAHADAYDDRAQAEKALAALQQQEKAEMEKARARANPATPIEHSNPVDSDMVFGAVGALALAFLVVRKVRAERRQGPDNV